MREVRSNDDRDDASFGGRKRVTISGISRSLGLSRETTRRHVATLELADLLMRDEDGGLYLSDSQVRSAEIAALISEGETSLKILQRRSALVDSK